MCKLHKVEISNCGGLTSLWNHLQSIHPLNTALLPHNSARAKKHTESIAEFIVRDLRSVSTVDGVMVF